MDVTAADVDVSQMSDEELANRLQILGFPPGPIVDSTRSVYERKFLRLINKEDVNTSDTEEHQYEAGDMQSTFPKISRSAITNSFLIDSHTTHSPVTSSNSFSAEIASSPLFRYDELRRRPLTRAGMSWSESPTPTARSLSESPLDKRISSQLSEPSDSSSLSFGVKLAILVCVLLFAILLYWNTESSSSNPIPDFH